MLKHISACLVLALCTSANAGGVDDFIFKRHVKNLTSDNKGPRNEAMIYLTKTDAGRLAMFEVLEKLDPKSPRYPELIANIAHVPFTKGPTPKLTALIVSYINSLDPKGPGTPMECLRFLPFLQGIGPAYAKDALPLLRRLEESEDVDTAVRARFAIKAIEKATAK